MKLSYVILAAAWDGANLINQGEVKSQSDAKIAQTAA